MEFQVDKDSLSSMIDNKDAKALATFQGATGLANRLNTSLENGLSKEEMDQQFAGRIKQYGTNVMPTKPPTSFFSLYLDTLGDRTLIILLISAAISIVLGVTVEKESHGWIEGAAIIVAVQVVALVTSGNNYQKEKQFRKLNAIKDDTQVKLVRGGEQMVISTLFLMVGDVVLLETGDKIPADGVIFQADDLKVDEAAMTGESDSVKKNAETSPFALSGTQVVEGKGKMLVVAVGVNSQWGKIKATLDKEAEDTPLQQHLEELADTIGKMGLVAAILTFLTLASQWLNKEMKDTTSFELADLGQLVEFLITSITIVVVAVPEGLPLAVTISLAYSMFKMMKDNNLVRHLEACETMGGATNICSDKTGTLTENKMTLTKAWIAGVPYSDLRNPSTFTPNEAVKNLFILSIALNSSAFIKPPSPVALSEIKFEDFDLDRNGNISREEWKQITEKLRPKGDVFVGSKTECALLQFIGKVTNDKYEDIRKRYPVQKNYPFSSEKKRMTSILPKDATGKSRVLTKGASEIILGLCTKMLDQDNKIVDLSPQQRKAILDNITAYASEGLRTIGLAYNDLPAPANENWGENAPDKDFIFVGLVGIEDPVRREVPDAVQQCKDAGITVRMLTGDNILTAKSIAKQCGIFTEGGIAIEGPDFRRLSDEEVDKILPKLQVMARCSPTDKLRLVQRLRFHGEVVAVTGDGTNDAPQLKEADVGFAMGIAGTEVAKDASDIILLDDNFNSIVKAVMWGRNVFDSIRKFVQFQATVNVVAVTVAFVGAVSNGESPLKPVQMLWVNLIMDTMAALALATAPPHPDLLKRKPYGRFEGIITPNMWKNIFGQAIYQLVVLGVLLYAIELIPFFDLTGHPNAHTLHTTIIFNTFVLCQLFNEINATKLGNEFNVLSGVLSNPIFIGILIFTSVVQFLMVQFGGEFVQVTPLNGQQWLGCVLIGAGSLVVGFILRLIPVPSFAPPVTAEKETSKRHMKRSLSYKVPPELKQPSGRRASLITN